MALPPDNVYFPPLGELLEGETVLLSWKLIASALADRCSDRLATRAVADFLADPFVLHLLQSPAARVFEPPSPQSATALETRTAAIHVTPTPHTDKYDLATLKADALWLSRAAQISEVAALRLAVIELQTRNDAFLATPLSSQDATNIQKAAAAGFGGSTTDESNGNTSGPLSVTALSSSASTLDAEDLWSVFGSRDSQRRRLLATYLSERRYLAMTADYIASLLLHGWTTTATPTTTTITTTADPRKDLRLSLATGLYGSQPPPQALLAAVPSFIGELRACMERAELGIEGGIKEDAAACGPQPPSGLLTEELAMEWVHTALTEAVHYMSVVFLALHTAGALFLPPPIVVEWFRFVGDFRFLDGLTPTDDIMADLILPLKTLACVNSLVLLNLNRAIAYLDHDLDLDNDEEPYINDSDVLETMHAAIVGAADEALATASPVFLSWSLILHRMDVSYQERAERRDLTQNQRAQDGFELDNQPPQPLQPRGRRSSVGSIVSIEAARYDAFLSEKVLAVQAVQEDASGLAMAPRLAMTATEQCQVYDVIAAMAGSAGCSTDAALRVPLGEQVRLAFLGVLKASFPIIGYQSDPLTALLAVLSGGRPTWYEDVHEGSSSSNTQTVAEYVLRDGQLMQFYVHNALRRFPYEFTPFVSISRLLAAYTGGSGGLDEDEANETEEDDLDLADVVLQALLQTPSLTFNLPQGYTGYTMIDDDDHVTATMQTTEDIMLFPVAPRSRRRIGYRPSRESGEGGEMGASGASGMATVIPAGTFGRFMIDGSGIVNLDHGHSTLALLGKWLDASIGDKMCMPMLGKLDKADAAEAIQLLVALVRSEMQKATRKAAAAGRRRWEKSAARARQSSSSSSKSPSSRRNPVSHPPAAIEAGLAVLQEASRDLDTAKDVVSVVCDIVDILIQDGPGETDERRLAVLAACMDFLATILPLCPGRVWSYMARCHLLNTEAHAGRLCILTGASDVVSERFSFLMASMRFLAGLVDSAASSAVQRRVTTAVAAVPPPSSSALATRHGPSRQDSIWLGASDTTLTQVCLAVSQTVIDLYENTTTWKFASEIHRSSLVAQAIGILRDIVVYAASLEVPEEQYEKKHGGRVSGGGLFSCLDAAAEFVVTSFLVSSSSSSLRVQPLLTTLLLALELPPATLYLDRHVLVVQRTAAALELATVLLRVAGHTYHVTGSGASQTATAATTTIETQIFQLASLPARLCAPSAASVVASASLRQPALELLTELVVSAASTPSASEPPSLLGFLGPHVARSFLGVLSAMDRPFGRAAETARVYKFFSAILRHRQQWMANCLLTGKTPREALLRTDAPEGKNNESEKARLSSDSALARAQTALGSIATLPHIEALALLDFVSAAQNFWPWTIFAGGGNSGSSESYLDSMRTFVSGLVTASVRAKTDADAAYGEARIAAYVAEIFAMQLYHMRQMGTDEALARDVVQAVDYYLRDGVTVAGYNTSLHANFQRNFAARYPGVGLDQFKRSLVLQPRGLGSQFFYALGLADQLLAFDSSWASTEASSLSASSSSPPPSGFRLEMQTANRNLSLVDAQIALYHAWEVLLLELSICLLPRKNTRLPIIMLQVAEQCLAANNEGGPQGPQGMESDKGGKTGKTGSQPQMRIFAKLAHSRANLALLLLQRLAGYDQLPRDISQLLLTVWTSISAVDVAPWSPEQAPYYRVLLRILYVVLRGGRRSRTDEKTTVAGAGAGAPDGRDESQPEPPAVRMDVSTNQTVLAVLDRVVASGFRTLVGMVHDPESESRPDDLALLTAVLQACLSCSTAGMRESHAQVLNIMAGHDVLHVAVSLFSWSDKLLLDEQGVAGNSGSNKNGNGIGSGNGDPVYGELSLLFLLELSALPIVAEQLACDGFLGHLVSAGLAAHMRRPGVSPFADSAGAQRCYSIWAKAVLPILLNILIALGNSIAPEIAYVLNQFPALLESSVQRFEAPGLSRTSNADSAVTSAAKARGGSGVAGVAGTTSADSLKRAPSRMSGLTLLSVSEVHSLALLTQVLAALRVNHPQDIVEVRWDAGPVVESIDYWVSRPKLLRERLVPLGPREAEWRSMEPMYKGMAENRLEEKVFSLLDVIRTVLGGEE